ncbi:MAG: J domain-containing protein, partial [Dokdonella sp.]
QSASLYTSLLKARANAPTPSPGCWGMLGMSPTDFLLLYQQLGLRPDSSVEELKLAYRRRVAALHPDRQCATNTVNVELARERLQQLTALYGSVTAFHRRHGRLPGASIAPQPALAAAILAPATTRRRRTGQILLVAVGSALSVLATVVWLWPDFADDGGASGPNERSRAAQATLEPATGTDPELTLQLGMLKDDVLSIEKEPIARGDDRWDYGPSWIAFERGKVSGWYSSPLRPLQRATTRPPPRSIEHTGRTGASLSARFFDNLV